MIDLNFQVRGAEILFHSFAPSLAFNLCIENRGQQPICSMMLETQVQIVPSLRPYSAKEKEQLYELFGPPVYGTTSLKTMLWTNTVEFVPGFSGSTTVDLYVQCTYDFEVATAKYFHGLEEGEIPLKFLFSGSVFYAGERGLQVEQIPWDKQAAFHLPIKTWKEMMDHYFPNSTWMRVGKDVFDRLYAYKASQGLYNWDAALEKLLGDVPEEENGYSKRIGE